MQVEARRKVRSGDVADDYETRLVGHIQEIVEILVAAEITDHMQRFNQSGRHFFIWFCQDPGERQIPDPGVASGRRKGEALHIEKSPVGLQKPEEILAVNSFQETRLGETL